MENIQFHFSQVSYKVFDYLGDFGRLGKTSPQLNKSRVKASNNSWQEPYTRYARYAQCMLKGAPPPRLHPQGSNAPSLDSRPVSWIRILHRFYKKIRQLNCYKKNFHLNPNFTPPKTNIKQKSSPPPPPKKKKTHPLLTEIHWTCAHQRMW